MEEFKARYEEEQAKKLAALKKQARIAERKSRDYLTASNDNTWVKMNNGRVKNPHLTQRAVQGAKALHEVYAFHVKRRKVELNILKIIGRTHLPHLSFFITFLKRFFIHESNTDNNAYFCK